MDDNSSIIISSGNNSNSHVDVETTTMTDHTANIHPSSRITTLIFDVDDTLYDIHTEFTKYRNGTAVYQFMVDYLHFDTIEHAKIVRDEYFHKYHSTAKALTIAEQEGRFPPIPVLTSTTSTSTEAQDNSNDSNDPSLPATSVAAAATEPRFRVEDLSKYWATQLDYSLLGGCKVQFLQDMKDLIQSSNNTIQIIAFSNGPRTYVIRVLQELGLWDTLFTKDTLFAVDDVLPYCKPEREAFDVIFQKLSILNHNRVIVPNECIMIEDSMKNIRAAKAYGMKTIYITGNSSNEKSNNNDNNNTDRNLDPSVIDIAIETVEQIRDKLPSLWYPNNPCFSVIN